MGTLTEIGAPTLLPCSKGGTEKLQGNKLVCFTSMVCNTVSWVVAALFPQFCALIEVPPSANSCLLSQDQDLLVVVLRRSLDIAAFI